MSYEIVLFVVTMTHSASEVASYSLLAQIPAIMAFIILGGTIEPKTWVNHALRKKNYPKARKIFWAYSLAFCILGFVTCFPVYLYCADIFESMGASPEVIEWIKLSSFWLALDCFMISFQYWPIAMMISLDLKPILVFLNIFFGGFGRVFLSWLFIV